MTVDVWNWHCSDCGKRQSFLVDEHSKTPDPQPKGCPTCNPKEWYPWVTYPFVTEWYEDRK